MGQRPGGAFGVGHGGAGGEAVGGQRCGDGAEHGRLAAEQMGAAGGVEEKAVIRGADDRREALGPAGERVAEGGEALGLLGPGDQGGADGAGVRQAEAGGEAQSRRRRVDRDQPQRAALLSNDGEGAGGQGPSGSQKCASAQAAPLVSAMAGRAVRPRAASAVAMAASMAASPPNR